MLIKREIINDLLTQLSKIDLERLIVSGALGSFIDVGIFYSIP